MALAGGRLETISAPRTKFPGAVTFRKKAAPAVKNVGIKRSRFSLFRKISRAKKKRLKEPW